MNQEPVEVRPEDAALAAAVLGPYCACGHRETYHLRGACAVHGCGCKRRPAWSR
jgi:hypothetical protein